MAILPSSPSGQPGPSPSRPPRPSRRTGETAAAAPPPSPRRAAAQDLRWDTEPTKSSAPWGESKPLRPPPCRSPITAGQMRKGRRPSAAILLKTGPNALPPIAAAGPKSGKNSSATLFCAHPTGHARRAPPRTPDLPRHLSTRKTRVRGRPEPPPPSHTRRARPTPTPRPLKEGIHPERPARRKTAAPGPPIPPGSPTSPTPLRPHRSSTSAILPASRSSRSSKSVTVRLSSRAAAWTESTRSRVCFVLVTMASNSSLSSLTDLLVASMSSRSSRNAGISTESTASLTAEFTTEFKVLWCSLNASSMRLAIALSSSSLEMAESLNFFFIGDCSISLFRSPLSALVLMMGLMQSDSNFTDRIVKYLAKWAERKTKPASPSRGHVILSTKTYSESGREKEVKPA